MLTDTHAHLDDPRYDDLEAVIERAGDLGFILDPGSDKASSLRAVEIAETFDKVYAAVGFHPEELESYSPKEDLPFLKKLAKHPKVLAIGEIGLDYHWDDNPEPAVQQQALIDQIRLAGELNLPFIIHDRDAHEDVFRIVTQEMKTPAVFHAFSGDEEFSKKLLDYEIYISVGGVLTFKKPGDLPNVVKSFPLKRIMLETDSPYMTPVPYRGKRNEPSYTKFVAEKIAEIKDLTVEEVLEQTEQNALRFFKLKK